MRAIRRALNIFLPALLLMHALVLLSGCAITEFVQLREKPRNPLADRLNTSALGFIRHSKRTELFLQKTGYRGHEDLKQMIVHASGELDGEYYFEAAGALAELNYLAGEVVRSHDPQLASEFYLDSSQAAWKYFSRPDSSGLQADPNRPEHRSTAEVYNTSTESLLRIARARGHVRLGQSLVMPLSGRRLNFEIPFSSRLLTPDQLGDFEFVSDYELKNLQNRHTSAGLGVPIIAIRNSQKQADVLEKYYPHRMSFAATIVFRFDDSADSVEQSPDVRLQIFDPRESDGLVVGETLMPLETDVSTPLARYLSNRDLSLLDTWAFIRPASAQSIAGLYMVQPYDPDRIPVLMVHGIWSSPMTWMEMFNELQSDPEIRRKYQFWFYLYPTSEPLAFSAANLRDALKQVRDDCDPYRRNHNLDNTVVVGHSMGGLVSHMLTIDSGDRLWRSVSGTSADEIQATPEVKSEIHRVFFFQATPSVSRIITIASPYRGSSFSNTFTQWVTGSLVRLPAKTYELSKVIFEENKGRGWDRFTAPRTSVDSLTKKSAVLTLIRDSVLPPDVRHHNIIGVKRGADAETWTDGVVSYRSAHCDDVTSEKVVSAGHRDIIRHSETVAEVRRILLDHLRESQRRRFPVLPVRSTVETNSPTSAGTTLVP